MRYLSVCSGIEAASVAWHPLGWEPAAFCEIEAFPSAVLSHRYPNVPNYGDFTRLTDAAHPIHGAGVDLLVGGTPCQAFSVAGLRKGLADPRGGLTLEFVRLAQALRPKWIVWENVPGVLSQDGGRAFGAFLGALGELGYGFAYRVLDAQYARVDGYPHAVPQRRRRVFVVGHSGGDAARAAAVLFEPEGVRGHTPPRRASRKATSCDAAGGFAVCGTLSDGAHHGGGLNGQDAYTGRILPVAFDARHNDVLIYGDKTGTLDTDGSSIGVCVHEAPIAAIPYDLFQVTAPLNRQSRDERSPCHTLARDNAAHAAVVTATPAYDPCPTLTSRMQGSSGWSPYKEDAHLVAHAAVVQPVAFTENHEGRVYEHDYIGALNQGGGKPGMCYPAIRTGMSVRRLTPTECERLQGFPDGWTQIPWKGKSASECPDGPRYKALGNSMACNVMRWIGTRIAMVDAAGVGV